MYEYLLGNKYHWTYSSSVGSSYQDTAYLDLGVVTNTGRKKKIFRILMKLIGLINRSIGYRKYIFEYNR
jgi:hypothetical protein